MHDWYELDLRFFVKEEAKKNRGESMWVRAILQRSVDSLIRAQKIQN